MQAGDPSFRLTPDQGNALVSLARGTLYRHFDNKTDELATNPHLADISHLHGGTFVTLTLNHQLRGCIGSLTSADTLIANVHNNALSAAFRDPRFSPLTREELDRIQIEVSVLTIPEPLTYTDARDLVARLRPRIDGVIIQKGRCSATFLPQVWDQLPRPDAFLTNLCLKAGLAPNAWEKGDLAVSVYQVQSFEEETM